MAHADAMFAVLSDPRIYTYLDYGPPPSREHVRNVYARLEAGRSPDGAQRWLNWVIRAADGTPIGTVQATLFAPRTAWVAWVLASRHWGRGHARRAVLAMIEHLASDHDIAECRATIEAENARSIALATAVGFRPATPLEAAAHDLSPTESLFIRPSPF